MRLPRFARNDVRGFARNDVRGFADNDVRGFADNDVRFVLITRHCEERQRRGNPKN